MQVVAAEPVTYVAWDEAKLVERLGDESIGFDRVRTYVFAAHKEHDMVQWFSWVYRFILFLRLFTGLSGCIGYLRVFQVPFRLIRLQGSGDVPSMVVSTFIGVICNVAYNLLTLEAGL